MKPCVPFRSVGDRFADRTEAGALLGENLRSRSFTDPLILALPRGGVPVAYEIARRLGAPMEVLISRKVGAPGNPEYAIGAMVEGGFYHLNFDDIETLHIPEGQIEMALDRERSEIRRRIALYRQDLPLPRVRGRQIILVDDGIATGETARVAVRLLRDRGAREIILAAPVCPAYLTARKDFPEIDELVVLRQSENFRTVGEHYHRFSAVNDDAVVQLAGRGRILGPLPARPSQEERHIP